MLFRSGLAVGPGLLVLYVLMLVFLPRHRITREGHAEVLAELERRRIEALASGADGA